MKIPDKAFEKFFAMTGLLIIFLASCSNMLHTPPKQQFHIMPKTEYVTRVIIQHDTVVKTLQTDDVEFRKRVEALIKNQNIRFDSSENHLKDLTVLLSQQNLYLSTRARMYRNQKDSLALVMIHKLDSSRRENLQGFKETREARSLNKSTFGMFETIGTFCFVIVILSSLINVSQWINSKLKKSPAL